MHFFVNNGKTKLSLQDRRTNRESKTIRLHYKLFDKFCRPDVDFTQFEEEDFSEVKYKIKAQIEEHLVLRQNVWEPLKLNL